MAYSTLAGRLKRLIASFRQHGFGHVLEVLRQSCVRQAYARTPHGLPERSDFLRSFAALQSSSESVVHHLMLTSRRLLMPWMEEDHGVRQQLLSTRSLDEFRKDADLIASGRFTGLGVGIVEPSGKFDWYRDYVSGKVWPLQSFHQIRFLQGDGADIKYPWELSRMYWIGWLGLARSVEQPSADNDPRAESFKDLIDDWRESNPINIGPNWAMPMEVGIRGFWLVMGAAFFGDSETLSDEWWGDYYRLLWGHGNYLDNNLEYFPNLTNHYIANCFGLLTVGALFIETGKGKRWFGKGKKRLAKELFRQVTEDGVHYERSVSYHALVLEMYLIALIVAERVGQPFNPNEKLQVSRMAAFLRDCIPPGKATAPQLGDSDDGVILRLSSRQELYNYCGLLALAERALGIDIERKEAKISNHPSLQERDEHNLPLHLLFGNKERKAPSQPRSRLYAEGGFASLRNHYFFLFVDVGPIGLHGNNDTLSFTLHSSDGRAWFVDPGTGCYTRDESLRNQLRSTSAHNTPFIDGREIARFAGLWRVESDRTQLKIIKSNLDVASGTEETPLVLEAEHRAYTKLPKGGLIVQRRWEMRGRFLEISDRIVGSGFHNVSIGFTIPGEIELTQLDAMNLEMRSNDPEAKGYLHFSCSKELNLLESFYSPAYGLLLPATRIEITNDGEAPLEIAYFCQLVSDHEE